MNRPFSQAAPNQVEVLDERYSAAPFERQRGKYCARIRYQDENGKHELLRTCDSKPEAKTKLAQLETELLEKAPAQLVAGKVTFRQLVGYAKTTRYPKATYDKHGAVVCGLRGFTAANSVLNQLGALLWRQGYTKN
jgi:hypothetical protein